MCHEVRGASVLAFKYRGPRTLIGPAFGASHIEAGCEFCGACVSVCPTGALADKVSKWDGATDAVEVSTCPFCGVGCQLEIGRTNGMLSWARGAHDEEINDGQLCVRGRFCLPEATHHPDRARKPMLRHGRYFRVAGWDEALDEVAGRLAAAAPRDVLMLVSADLTNESLYAAQRFVRLGLKSEGIDSTAGARLPGGPATWSRLFALPVSLHELGQAEAVVVAGLDSRFAFSVVGVQVRRAVRRGATLVVVDARESNLVRAADRWLPTAPGEEALALVRLLRALRGGGRPAADGDGQRPADGALLDAARRLAEAGTVAVVVGTARLRGPRRRGARARARGAGRARGHDGGAALGGRQREGRPGARRLRRRAAGAASGASPGAHASRRPWPAVGRQCSTSSARRPSPRGPTATSSSPRTCTCRPSRSTPSCRRRPSPRPAARSRTSRGACRSCAREEDEEARRRRRPARGPTGASSPTSPCGLAGRARLRRCGRRARAIRAEVPGFPLEGDRAPRRMTPMPARRRRGGARDATPAGAGRFVLVPEPSVFRHRGIDLAGVVEGLGELHLEDGLRMNPGDLDGSRRRAGRDRHPVAPTVSALALPARADPACPGGAVYATQMQAWGGRSGDAAPPALEPLSRLPARAPSGCACGRRSHATATKKEASVPRVVERRVDRAQRAPPHRGGAGGGRVGAARATSSSCGRTRAASAFR